MTLTFKEYRAYLETHLDLLFYVGQQLKIISSDIKFSAFVKLDLKIKFKCREAFLKNDGLLYDFITLNFDRLTTEQINILTGFEKSIKSRFIILKCLTHHAIFIDTKDNKFYAVKALGDRFDDFFSSFPVLITTTILPFYDKIIYDGFIESEEIYFGPENTRTLNLEYKEAKKRKLILTTI